jgi:tRNA (guanine26-N2/guanine27-N2)-dimethyltransferase
MLMELMTEGKAKFYASKDKDGKISRELEIFYNPVMKFNRDISISVLNNSGAKNFQVADIMAGSGVRSIRFLKELKKGIMSTLYVNDKDPNFMKLFKKTLTVNKIRSSKNILVTNTDANIMLLGYNGCDYIEIDPFGSPNDFLSASIIRLSRGGILAVTGTDTASLSGGHYDTCMRSYWGRPMHNSLMHEVGLRILIRKIQLVGSQHDKALIPMYTYFKDHYNRMFFRCIKGKLESDKLIAQHQYLLYCDKCMCTKISKYNNLNCDTCNAQMDYAGPMWTGKLFDKDLSEKIFKNHPYNPKLTADKEFIRFLENVMNESKLDAMGIVGFYDIHSVCEHFKKQIMNFEDLTQKIKDKGYVVSRTHFNPVGLKTNMPIKELLKFFKSN